MLKNWWIKEKDQNIKENHEQWTMNTLLFNFNLNIHHLYIIHLYIYTLYIIHLYINFLTIDVTPLHYDVRPLLKDGYTN